MTVSKEVYTKLKPILNEAESKVFIALSNYYTSEDEWPTYKELADFMGMDKNTVQPRLNELREDRMVVENGDKRPCNVSDHNISVNTWKIKDKFREDVVFG